MHDWTEINRDEQTSQSTHGSEPKMGQIIRNCRPVLGSDAYLDVKLKTCLCTDWPKNNK